MDSNQCQDRTSIDGTDGSGCTYSSRSTLPPRSEHNHDNPSRHETSHPLLFSTPPQTIKGSLLPNPSRHPTILSYQPHPLPLLRILRHHLLRPIP